MPYACGRCTWLSLGSPGEPLPDHHRTCPHHPTQQALRQQCTLRGVDPEGLRRAAIAVGELLLAPSREHERVLREAVPGLTWGRLRGLGRAVAQLEEIGDAEV
jgi:hypothetical protein